MSDTAAQGSESPASPGVSEAIQGGETGTGARVESAGSPGASRPDLAGDAGGEPKEASPGQVTKIRPIPRNLGFDTKEDLEDIPDLLADSRARAAAKEQANRVDLPSQLKVNKAGREYDPKTGQYSKPAAPENVAAQPATKPPAPQAGAQVAQTGTGTYSFAGRNYKDQAEAEQSFRSLQGMFKPLTDERNYGYQTAHQWKAVADQAQARVAELESKLGVAPQGQPGGGGQPPQAAAATEMPTVDSLLEGVDTDAFEAIAKQAGLPMAGKYLVAEVLRTVQEKILPVYDQRLQRAVAPFQATHDRAAQSEAADQLIQQVGGLRSFDGAREMFPELKDAKALYEIGNAWRSLGLPPDQMLTHQGLIAAIGLYRSLQGFTATEPASSSQPGQGNGVIQASPPPAPGAAALVASDPSSVRSPQGMRQSNLSPEAQRLANALDSTQLIDPKLGFARNPRAA